MQDFASFACLPSTITPLTPIHKRRNEVLIIGGPGRCHFEEDGEGHGINGRAVLD